MTVSKHILFNRKTIVHALVLIASIFSLYVTADSARNRYHSLFQGGFYDTLLFVFTIYVIALVIIPLLFQNWKKYLYVAVGYIIFYSLLLGWMGAIQDSNSAMLKNGISTEPLEYFTLESVLKSSMTLIPMGVMGLFYYVFVMDWEKLKKGFFQNHIERIINFIVVVLVMFYVSIMPAGTKTDEENQKRGLELQEKQQRIQQFRADAQKDLASKEAELFKPIQEAAMNAINEVAKAKGYEYVIDRASLIVANGTDILADVKKQLGI